MRPSHRTAKDLQLLQQFDDVLESGEDGLINPDPAIFNLAIDRFGVILATTLFLDDSAANIATTTLTRVLFNR